MHRPMFLGAKFKFRREREMKTKGERKEEKKRNVAWWAGKKSSCCVPSIPSPAKYRHVQVIIQSGREERVFQPRHRARIKPWPTSNFTALNDQSSFAITRNRICRWGTMGWQGAYRTGRSARKLERAQVGPDYASRVVFHHRIPRILFTAGAWMRAHLSPWRLPWNSLAWILIASHKIRRNSRLELKMFKRCWKNFFLFSLYRNNSWEKLWYLRENVLKVKERKNKLFIDTCG